MSHPLFDWAVAHPWLAFGLSFPLAYTLVAIAWAVANVVTTLWSTLCSTLQVVASALAVTVRGYPPPPAAEPEDPDNKPLAA